MTREKIEEQIMDAKTIIANAELQLKLPPGDRDGEKDGKKLRSQIIAAKKRKKELERWIQSGFFEGRGGSHRQPLARAA